MSQDSDARSRAARRCSSVRSVRCISPRRRKAAVERSHSRLSKAGMPESTLPAGTLWLVALLAVSTTSSPISRCPATPTCPARMTRRPTRELPASPTCAHKRVSSPTAQEWPTCTRLSIFAPRADGDAGAEPGCRVNDGGRVYQRLERLFGMEDEQGARVCEVRVARAQQGYVFALDFHAFADIDG